MSDQEFQYGDFNETADYDYENVDNDEINMLNPKDPGDMSQYHRLMIQGKCVKLPNTESIDDELYQNFMSGFMTDIKDDENERSKVFRFLWKDEEENVDLDGVPYGVPGDIDDIVKLIEMGRIVRTSLPECPDPGTWGNVKKVTTESFRLKDEMIEIEDQSGEKKPKQMKATSVAARKVFDSIVNFISGNET